MESENCKPYYSITLQQLRKGIASLREIAGEMLAEAQQVEAQLNNIGATSKPERCPFCGGKMFDMSALANAQFHIWGSPVTEWELHRSAYGARVPHGWECQLCAAYVTSPPRENAQRWLPSEVKSNSKSVAALFFKHFSFVDEVALELNTSQQAWVGWLARVKDKWFYIAGPKDRVLQVLNLD